MRTPGSRALRFRTCTGSLTARGPLTAHDSTIRDVAFRLFRQRRHPEELDFAAQWLACTYPYPTLRHVLAGRRRTAHGHRGSLLLRCKALLSSPQCQFIPALSETPAAEFQGASDKSLSAYISPMAGQTFQHCRCQGDNCRTQRNTDLSP